MEGKKVKQEYWTLKRSTLRYSLRKISSLLPKLNFSKEQYFHVSLLNALGSQNETSSHYLIPIRQTYCSDGTTILQIKSWLNNGGSEKSIFV